MSIEDRENVDPSAPIGIESEIGSDAWPNRTFGERLLAALKLDSALYEEIEHDDSALSQAIAIVAMAALASSVGSVGLIGLGAVLPFLATGFLTWLVWTVVAWAIGVRLFEHSSSFGELLRTLGFVAAPQLLYVLLLIPVQGWQILIGLVVTISTAVAFVRALRQALDVSLGQALIVAGLSIAAHFALGGLLMLFGSMT